MLKPAKDEQHARDVWLVWKKAFDAALVEHIKASLAPGADQPYPECAKRVAAFAAATADAALEQASATWISLWPDAGGYER